LKESVKEFKTARIDKAIPALNKKLVMYDDMKRYAVSDPKYVTKAISIENEKHTISIYKKAPGSETKVLHDYINIEPTRGFKLSVAGGLFVSGLTDQSFSKKTKDSIYTSKYLLDGVSRDTTKSETFTSLYEKDQADISYGGMLFLQAQSRNASVVNYGGFVGFGAMFNDQTRWAGSIGGSLLIGKAQKFNINIGAVIGQVERLTQPYKPDTWYRETLDNIPTYKAWDVSWMVGFSWSFK
jgi:hypothetical protein